jgi:hypothetical protein
VQVHPASCVRIVQQTELADGRHTPAVLPLGEHAIQVDGEVALHCAHLLVEHRVEQERCVVGWGWWRWWHRWVRVHAPQRAVTHLSQIAHRPAISTALLRVDRLAAIHTPIAPIKARLAQACSGSASTGAVQIAHHIAGAAVGIITIEIHFANVVVFVAVGTSGGAGKSCILEVTVGEVVVADGRLAVYDSERVKLAHRTRRVNRHWC